MATLYDYEIVANEDETLTVYYTLEIEETEFFNQNVCRSYTSGAHTVANLNEAYKFLNWLAQKGE